MPKIYYLDDFDNEFNEENWVMKLDISILYDKFSNQEIDYNEFTNKLNTFILSKKDKLTKISEECFNDFNKDIKNEFKDIKEFYIYVDSVYDWADKYNINIICKDSKKEEKEKDETSN